MKKGGYKIIDLKGEEIDTSGTSKINVPGVYDEIEGSYGKAILLSGLNIDGTIENDIFVRPEIVSDDFVVTLGVVASTTTGVTVSTLTIDDDDDITYATVTYVAAE